MTSVGGDALYQVQQWIQESGRQDRILLFGAPYEADAQLVQLERQVCPAFAPHRSPWFPLSPPTHQSAHPDIQSPAHVCPNTQGIVDGILTTDADVFFLGGQNIHGGYETRASRKYRSILKGISPFKELNELSTAQRATLSCFAGAQICLWLCSMGIMANE